MNQGDGCSGHRSDGLIENIFESPVNVASVEALEARVQRRIAFPVLLLVLVRVAADGPAAV